MHGRPGRARLRRLQAAPPGTWLLRAGMWPQPEILVWAMHRGLWGRGLHGTCRDLELWGREGLEKQPRGTGCREPRPSRGGDLSCDVAPDLCSSLLVTRPRVKPAGVGSTSRGRRRRAARGSHAGVLPGRLGVRGDLSAHSRQARSPWTRCEGRAGGGSGRLVPHPRLAQLPGVWAAAHCSRCPRRHRSRGLPSASHVPDRCA